MTHIHFLQLCTAAAIGLSASLWTSCSGHNHEEDGHASEASSKEHQHESELLTIHIDDHDASMLGIRSGAVRYSDFAPSLITSGEISAPASETATIVAPTSGTLIVSPGIVGGARVNAGSTIASIDQDRVAISGTQAEAEAILRARREEYERLKPLYSRGLVTAPQLNDAREAYERALAALPKGAVSRRAVTPIRGTVTALLATNGQFVQAGDPIATVSRSSRLTLKAFVPDRHTRFTPRWSDVLVSLPGADTLTSLATLSMRQLTDMGSAATDGGYVTVAFEFDNPGFPAGTTPTTAHLLAAPERNILTVPTSAITEEMGQHFVYRITSPEHYLKTPVQVGRAGGKLTEITGGLAVGDSIVVSGAPMVRMAQSQAAPVHGHSHNH